MAPDERLSDFLLPRPRTRDAGPMAPRGSGSFWDRHLHPPSALVLAVAVVVLAAVASLVATVVYSNIDAGRPLVTEVTSPTTVPDEDPGARLPGPAPGGPPTTVSALLTDDVIADRLRASVWGVSTFDPAGQPAEGSAFVAGSFGGRTLLVTSLAVVRAATQAPPPPIRVRQGSRTLDATLWTWQEESDLALLVVSGSSPSLPLATGANLKGGDRVYTMAADRPLTPGIVTAAFEDGLDHNVFVEPVLQGAPLVNQRGEVVGVVSLVYNPGGRGSTTTFIGVPIRTACARVITCGAGNLEPETPNTTTPARD